MKRSPARWLRAGRSTAVVVGLVTLLQANAADALDIGNQVPDAATIKEGLFPEDACKELEAAGFKCMGFKPAVRYSLPATSFKIGSADLPEMLRRQLDVFADALRGKQPGPGRTVRIEGHADATGTPEANQSLSQRRAEAVRAYLIDKGADGALLEAVGLGATAPKNATDPFAAENRRVEIGRNGAKP